MAAKTDWTPGEQVNDVKLNALGAAVNALGPYTHTQSSAAATWTITHTLGRKPSSVQVFLSDQLVFPDIDTPNTTTVVVTFASPQSGRAEIR